MTLDDLHKAAEAVGKAIHEPFLEKNWPNKDAKKLSFEEVLEAVDNRIAKSSGQVNNVIGQDKASKKTDVVNI